MCTYIGVKPPAWQEEHDVERCLWSRHEHDEGEEGKERRERAALDCEQAGLDNAGGVVVHKACALVDEEV